MSDYSSSIYGGLGCLAFVQNIYLNTQNADGWRQTVARNALSTGILAATVLATETKTLVSVSDKISATATFVAIPLLLDFTVNLISGFAWNKYKGGARDVSLKDRFSQELSLSWRKIKWLTLWGTTAVAANWAVGKATS